MTDDPPIPIKGLRVAPISGEPYRYLVSSESGGDEYLVDIEARWPQTRCSCRNYDCVRWPDFKRSLTADHCKHSRAALVFHALRHVRATSKQLMNNDGE